MRNYKRKKEIRYTDSDLKNAVDDVRNGLKFRQAQEKWNVPASVISNRISGRKHECKSLKCGRKPVFELEIEEQFVDCILARGAIGYPVSKKEFIALVAEYIKHNDISNPFKDGIPGDDWYQGFMDRHPRLTLKKAQNSQKVRFDARKPEIVYDFYDKMENLVKNHPTTSDYVFNCDESGFALNPSKVRAIGSKGQELHRVFGGSGRDSISVLACVAASGAALPPLIIFKGKSVQQKHIPEDRYPGTDFATSENGWMEEAIYFSWFTKTFIPYVNSLREKNNESNKSAILIFDGHSSHTSLRILLAAKANNIHLMRLPSHLTDLLQPLDKTVFSPLKRAWDEALIEFGKKNIGLSNMTVSKYNFVQMLSTVWKSSLTSSNIKSGFESCGLFPVNRKKFPRDKFDPLELKKYEQFKVASASNPGNFKIKSPGKFTLKSPKTPVMDENTPQNSISPSPSTSANTSTSSEDSPLDLSISVKPSSKVITITTRNVVKIFCDSLKEKNSEMRTTVKNTVSIPRLNSKYGEVVTGEEVISRIRGIEEEREKKRLEIENRKRIREEKKNEPKPKKENLKWIREENKNEKNEPKPKNICRKLTLNSEEVKENKPELRLKKLPKNLTPKKTNNQQNIIRKPKEVEVGQWLIVRVGKEPTWRYFIAQLIKARNGKLIGNFLRPAFTTTHLGFVYKYPQELDKYKITFSDILASLPDPVTHGRRGLMRFNVHANHLPNYST